MIKNIYKKFTYNTAIYRFREMIEDLYQTKNLEKLNYDYRANLLPIVIKNLDKIKHRMVTLQ